MFYVRVYHNTRFDLVNVPDRMELLEQFSHKDYPVIDLLQLYHNTQIKLKITDEETDLADADFLVLCRDQRFDIPYAKKACYVINGYTMTSADVATLDVTMEPFLTAGGINYVTLKSGMTERHHVDNNQENFGEFGEDDELLQPTYPMKMIFGGQYFYENTPVGSSSGIGLVWTMSRIDNANFDINNNIDWVISSDAQGILTGIQSNTSGNNRTMSGWECWQPWIGNVQDYIAGRTDVANRSTHRDFANLTCYVIRDNNDFTELMNNIKKLYEWGVTDMIKDAYFIPRFWANTLSYFSLNVANILRTYVCTSAGYYTSMKARVYDSNHVVGGKQVGLMNPRAFYGKHFAVSFVATGSGEIISKNPEELLCANRSISPDVPFKIAEGYQATTSGDDADKNIIVLGWNDVRSGGTPKFHVLCKADPGDFTNGFYIKDYIRGSGWSKIPITMMGVQGAAQSAIQYQQNRDLTDYNTMLGTMANQDPNALVNGGAGLFSGISGWIQKGKTGIYHGAEQAVLNQFGSTMNTKVGLTSYGATDAQTINALSSLTMQGDERAKNMLQREGQARAEAAQFVSGLVPKPTIQYNGDIDGDAAMNSLVAFRLVPDDRDIAKFDTVLNMFGYKITEPVLPSFMTNRPKYNYLKAKGVEVEINNGGVKIPKSVREEIGSAFSQGLRIWHVKPTMDYSIPGSNRNEEV